MKSRPEPGPAQFRPARLAWVPRALVALGCFGHLLLAEEHPAPPRLNPIEILDLKIKKFSQAHHSGPADKFFDAVRWLGDTKVYLGTTAVFAASGELEFAELALKGGLIAGAGNESLRYVVGRARPRRARLPNEYRVGGKSMPSGHSSAAFALATALDETYGIGYATYPLATMTAMSRIYHNGHWFSDTAAGAGIGIASVKAVALHDEKRVDFGDSRGLYAEATGAFTVADSLALQFEEKPVRFALRAAAIGFIASRVDEEMDIYAGLAGVATSLVFTRGFRKFSRLKITPRSVSLVWQW